MKKLLLLAFFSQLIITCGKNPRHTTNQKNLRLDSFENTRYTTIKPVSNDSIETVKIF
jgi:hypothetical protein